MLKKMQELLERNPDVREKFASFAMHSFEKMTDEELVHAFEMLVVRCYRER